MIREYIMHIVTSYNKKQTIYDYFETADMVRTSDRQDIRYMARPIFEEYIGIQEGNCNDKYLKYKIQRHRDLSDRIADSEKRMRIYREMIKFMELSEKEKQCSNMIENIGDIHDLEVTIEIVKDKGE